jgi:hypothetical protein
VVGFTVVSGREVPWKRKPVIREHNNIDIIGEIKPVIREHNNNNNRLYLVAAFGILNTAWTVMLESLSNETE